MIAHNLPPQPTPFVGRRDELAEIARLLADPACRLLTLTGPGGIGKTRLALEAVRKFADSDPVGAHGHAPLQSFSDDIYFIPLQPLTSPDFMVSTIADAIGLQFYGERDPRIQLVDYLRDKPWLLVLDNFEHLLDGVDLLAEILKHPPEVKLLVTSRERLNLREEWVLDIGGLNYPASEAETNIEDYAAVELFVQHAQRVNARFAMKNANKRSIVRICHLVGGMPLGIELAAAWARALSCQQIAHEIARSLDILQTPARNVEPRHRTMRAAFEPTWERLSEDERDVFMKLSVFRGGFTHEAADVVAGASVHVLSALVDKSLLRVDAKERYEMHELLRQFGEKRLESSGKAEATRDSHMNCFADFMVRREAEIRGFRQLTVLDEIEADFNNVRIAWLRTVQQKNSTTITKFLESLRSFCIMRARHQEGEELFRGAQKQFASDTPDQPPIWGRIITCRGWIQLLGGLVPLDAVQAQLEQPLAIARTHDDRAEIALCQWLLGIIAHWTGNQESAIAYLEHALAGYRALDDRALMGHVLAWIGTCQLNTDDALEFFRQAHELSREVGDLEMIAWNLTNMGVKKFLANHLLEAAANFQEALANHDVVRNAKGTMTSMYLLSQCAFLAGEFEKATAQAEDLLAMAINLNVSRYKKYALATLAIISILRAQDSRRERQLCEEMLIPPDVIEYRYYFYVMAHMGITISAFTTGEYQTARRHYQAQLQFGLPVSDDLFCLPACLSVGALMLAHEGESTRAVELLGLVFNHPRSATGWLEKWPLLNNVRTQLEAELGSAAYAAAWERGASFDMVETVRKLQADFGEPGQSAATQLADGVARPLNERELEILRLVAAGMSNKEIAQHLVITVNTVKWYVSEILSKMHVANRTQAVAHARALGMLS
jgi:predicted ATPase/DNA-binding CsgD family transcriptional regulator